MSGRPVILMLAGEASGDLHGARVAKALLDRWPNARLLGLGGGLMAEQGVRIIEGLDRLAVMGFAEIVRHIPYFWALERRLTALLDEGTVDLVLPIDYPGFNLRIAKRARARRLPVLYYIAPQVWAWRTRRARRLARDATRIAVILPFEEEIFRDAGGSAFFVGHPLLEDDAAEEPRELFLEKNGLDPRRPVLALFPGSRRQEIRHHWHLFLETGNRVRDVKPQTQLAVARAPSIPTEDLAGGGIALVEDSAGLLTHTTAALVKSGTTTLQAALAEVPFVTVWRAHPVTFALAKRLIQVPYASLANLVAGKGVVPEVFQNDATSEHLATLLLPLLDLESKERVAMVEDLSRVRDALGTEGAAERVAELAVEILEGKDGIPPARGTGE